MAGVELSGWQTDDGDFEDMRTGPVDLGFLADAPPGVATRLLDAALAGPVVFSEPDEDLRLAWIAWLAYALPDGAALTFSTAGDEDARVRVADEPGAIDTTEPCDLNPSLYARVAVQLAARGELRAAVARLDEPDGLALAVHGGATDLIAPHQLPLALQLITELATAGHVREAARAAAALPTGAAGASLVAPRGGADPAAGRRRTRARADRRGRRASKNPSPSRTWSTSRSRSRSSRRRLTSPMSRPSRSPRRTTRT